MSLHRFLSPANATLTLPSPVLRSNPLSTLPLSAPAMTTPRADRSFEQAHSVFECSSASTPNMEAVPKVPGLSQTSGAAPGRTRTMPPVARLPANRVPSRVDVTLSGKARSPGKDTESGADQDAALAKPSADARAILRKVVRAEEREDPGFEYCTIIR